VERAKRFIEEIADLYGIVRGRQDVLNIELDNKIKENEILMDEVKRLKDIINIIQEQRT
jgi:hypothetical protein